LVLCRQIFSAVMRVMEIMTFSTQTPTNDGCLTRRVT
jgi:hypothetical protein